jgi:hypothetical protein
MVDEDDGFDDVDESTTVPQVHGGIEEQQQLALNVEPDQKSSAIFKAQAAGESSRG